MLEIQLANQAEDILNFADVSLDILLYVNGQQRYRFDAGETNRFGQLSVGYEQLELKRAENQKFALMDYNTPLMSCDEKISIVVPSMADLRARFEAVEKWFPADAVQLSMRLKRSNNDKVAAAQQSIAPKRSGTTSVILRCS